MHKLALFVDLHWWLPFLRGTDGLTGRQRREGALRYMAGPGNRHTGSPRRPAP